MNFNSVVNSIMASWRLHGGIQLATLTVLTATFTVIISFGAAALNFRNILILWGEKVQMTAYIKDDLSKEQVAEVEKVLKSMSEFDSVHFVSKDDAKIKFSQQMASYAPDLLKDTSLANPFPASFEMSFGSRDFIKDLQNLAQKVGSISGVEDVSYGQDWVSNYASIFTGFWQTIIAVASVLLFGSLLVIGNSIRASIAHRKEEIEILQLVGATSKMVKAPFVVEGAIMGFGAALAATFISFVFYGWSTQLVAQNLSFLNLAHHVQFFSPSLILAILAGGAAVGAAGSYVCVRRVCFSSEQNEAAR